MTVRLANARLGDGSLVSLTVDEGSITAIEPELGPGPEPDLDLRGWLVVPSLVEPHAHLDKALAAEVVANPAGDLLGAIEAWRQALADGVVGPEDTVERATAALELLLTSGVTAVRTHVDVSPTIGVSGIEAVGRAAQRLEGLIDVEIVALVASPLTGSDGEPNRRALAAAIEAGADLVGGCPHLDPDGPGLIEVALAAGTEAGLGLDLHVDELLDPDVLTLRALARRVAETGFEGPVTASHCVSLGVQEPAVQAAVAAEVAEAGIAVVTLPQTNLYLQGRDRPQATPRGLTAIDALRSAGVTVAAGADNVQDPFNLVGRSDPLETAALLVMAGHQRPETALEMVTGQARAALGVEPVSIEVGQRADLVAIDAPSIRAAVAQGPPARRVIRGGRLVATSDHRTTIHR